MALIDLVQGKVKDESGKLTVDGDYTPAVTAALALYSKHLPKTAVKDLSGADSHDLALPSEWVNEFSTIKGVEYPIGEVPPVMIDNDNWALYQTPSGQSLRLLKEEPATGESVRVTFTVMRAESDVRTGDEDAVASLAAANCCDLLANIYTQTGDPTISADSVDYRSKGDEYSRRAKALRQRYYDHMGISPDDPQPGFLIVADAPASGRVRLTH